MTSHCLRCPCTKYTILYRNKGSLHHVPAVNITTKLCHWHHPKLRFFPPLKKSHLLNLDSSWSNYRNYLLFTFVSFKSDIFIVYFFLKHVLRYLNNISGWGVWIQSNDMAMCGELGWLWGLVPTVYWCYHFHSCLGMLCLHIFIS